jgi:glycosyltransferase involved in cell wall biosynthesis
MRSPRVSVICAVFNGAPFLEEAVESVLRQEFDDFELLLVDDGSTDGSEAIARNLADRFPRRIRYLAHPDRVNRGASHARNLGLAQATGELIAFIDSDDVWRPQKLSEQLRIMDENPVIGMLCGVVNYWSSWAGGEDRLVATGSRIDSTLTPPNALLHLYPLGVGHAPCPSDLMIRRSLVEGGCTFEETLSGPVQMYEDQMFFAKIYLSATVLFASRVWLDYRQHPDSCVSVVFRDGLYHGMRRGFLAWLERYVGDHPGPRTDQVIRAIHQARWDLDHPTLARLRRRARRFLSPEPKISDEQRQAGAPPLPS